MSLTLPTAITNRKDLQSISPILLIEFPDIPYHVASQEINIQKGTASNGVINIATPDVFSSATATFETWDIKAGDKITIDGSDYVVADVTSQTALELTTAAPDGTGLSYTVYNTYFDRISKNNNLGVDESINELVNSLSSRGTAGVTLVQFRESLRDAMLSNGPDLTASACNIYIKLENGVTLSDGVKIFEGTIASWSTSKDEMRISLHSNKIDYALIPGTLISEEDTNTVITNENKDWGVPLQYGDFGYDEEPELWGDKTINTYALAVYSGRQANGKHRFYVASHTMKTFPSAANFLAGLLYDQYLFQYINGIWCGAIVNDTHSDIAVTNSGECYFEFTFADISENKALNDVQLPPTDEYAVFSPYQNNNSGFADAIDGSSGTSCVVNNANGDYLSVGYFKASEKLEGYDHQVGSGNKDVTCIVELGTVTVGTGPITISVYRLSTATTITSLTVTGADSNTRVDFTNTAGNGIDNTFDIDDCIVIVDCTNDPGDSCEVKNIIVTVRALGKKLEDHPYLFVRCKGRGYSGTWGGRYTLGNLITNPIDMVESLVRDELSETNIDTDIFDDVRTGFSSVPVAASIYQQMNVGTLFKDICDSFNITISRSSQGKWIVSSAIATDRTFTVSGTGTADAQDIFLDQVTLTSNEFDNLPILKDSFKLSRTDPNNIYEELIIEYCFVYGTGLILSVSTGSGRSKKIENKYIATSAGATALRNKIDDIWFNQKMIASFKTTYSGLAKEVGDVINIQHDDLNSAILDAVTVAGQKWIIQKIRKDFRPAVINIIAIELL